MHDKVSHTSISHARQFITSHALPPQGEHLCIAYTLGTCATGKQLGADPGFRKGGGGGGPGAHLTKFLATPAFWLQIDKMLNF